MSFNELYQEIILDHSRNPRNRKDLSHISEELAHENPTCGDQIKFELEIDSNDIVQRIFFDGQGCAISMASASIMTELLTGKSAAEVKKEIAAFTETMTDREHGAEKLEGDLAALGGVINYPMRVKCATLAWHGLEASLDRFKKNQ